MKWLITGAGGTLGRELVTLLAGEQVVAANRDVLDIRDRLAIERAADGADVIVNAAAWTDVDGAERHEDDARAVNALGAENVALAARASGARLIHLSTDYVFDGTATSPYAETAEPGPTTAYGRTKAEGEQRVQETLEGRAVVLRTSWLYGIHGRSFPRIIAERLHREGAVAVVDDQKGQPTWARDVGERIVLLARDENLSGVFHASGAGEASWFDFAREIASVCGHDRRTVHAIPTTRSGRSASRPAYSVLSHGKWMEHGYPPMRTWRAMFRDAAPFLDLPTRDQENPST